MKAHLVFGDPRSPGNRVVFTKQVPESAVEVYSAGAHIFDDGRVYEGGLLSSYPTGPSRADSAPPYVSLLLSETIPSEELCATLSEAGWEESADLPRPEHLPFPVATTLVLEGGGSTEAWQKTMWLAHAFAPTQRTSLDGVGVPPLALSCLSMDLRRYGPHHATFAVLDGAQGPDAINFLNEQGWMRTALDQDAWASQINLSRAVEAQVTYVLGATVVAGAIIHDLSSLESLPYADILSQDVLEEVALALYDLGRADLVPDGLALPGMGLPEN